MVSILVKLFTKDKQTEAEKRSAVGKVCGFMGIFFNLLLFAAKFTAGFLSGSIAIIADAFNNLSDAGSSVIMLAGFRMAEKKPDPHHPFGHGRMEYISGLAVSFMIILMGVELLKSSFKGLIEPALPQFGVLTTAVLILSVFVKLYIFIYNRSFGKKINSQAMLATASDGLSDMVSTAAVLLCSVISLATGFVYIDAICGLVLSALILYAGVRAARETVSPLLGQPPSQEFVKQVQSIAMSDEKIIGIHDMIVHDYGPGRVMVSLHCEVSSADNVIELHEVIDGVETRISRELNCMAIIHMDPVDLNDELLTELRGSLGEIVKQVDERASFHDLRIVRASGHVNIIFDLLLPTDVKISEKQAKETVTGEIKKLVADCECIINIDNDFMGGNTLGK